MSGVRLALLLALAVLVAQAPAHAQGAVARTDDALFVALGGRPGIAALVDDFVPRLAADRAIGPFFRQTNLAELKKQLADQLCAVSGGDCVYEGADMKKAHADLKIAKADFLRMVEVLQDAMDACGIAFATQNRLLARLAPMHRDVITVR